KSRIELHQADDLEPSWGDGLDDPPFPGLVAGHDHCLQQESCGRDHTVLTATTEEELEHGTSVYRVVITRTPALPPRWNTPETLTSIRDGARKLTNSPFHFDKR